MKYALRLLQVACAELSELHIIVSDAGLRVLAEEENLKLSHHRLSSDALFGRKASNCFFYNPKDIGASIASGSCLMHGMVIIPCSMGSLASIAHGISHNLIHRAADVTLKEGRTLVLVPRETPLSAIHLDNMSKLSRVGARIVPAMPGFYHQPATIDQLVDMMVMKVLDQMGVQNALVPRWERAPQPSPIRRAEGNSVFTPKPPEGAVLPLKRPRNAPLLATQGGE